MKYTELKTKLGTFPLWDLYKGKDLIMNDGFELYLKPRNNPRVIKLEKNEAVILKGAMPEELYPILREQAISLVFATEKYDCKRPKDVFNMAEKDVSDRNKIYLKYELGLRNFEKEITLTINLIQEQMIGILIEQYNHIEYEQTINNLGIKDAHTYIDFNPVYTH